MTRVPLFLAAFAILTACGDGNPFTDNDTAADAPAGDTTTNAIPEDLSKNLQAAVYNASTNTLQLNLTGLDAGPANATYVRKPLLDIGNLQAYTFQNSSTERHFTAFADEASVPGGAVRAVVVSDGGQFGVYYSGGYYERDGGFSVPAGGTAKYQGQYVGVTNLDDPGGDLTPPPPGTAPETLPAQSAATSGTIFLTANFTDNLVNGAVFDRVIVHNGAVLPSLDLSDGVIAADGTFLGGVGYDGDTPGAIGSFGGTFAGTGSTAVGGVITLNEFFDDGTIADGNEREQGVFVLIQCGQPGGAPSC